MAFFSLSGQGLFSTVFFVVLIGLIFPALLGCMYHYRRRLVPPPPRRITWATVFTLDTPKLWDIWAKRADADCLSNMLPLSAQVDGTDRCKSQEPDFSRAAISSRLSRPTTSAPPIRQRDVAVSVLILMPSPLREVDLAEDDLETNEFGAYWIGTTWVPASRQLALDDQL